MKIGSREITAAPYVPENPRISRPLSAAARKPSNVLHRWSHRSRALDSTSDDSISLRSFTTAKSWQPTGDCPLFKLPAEINFEILSYLSYPEARQLKNTCRFFRMYITPGELLRYQTMWKTELLTLDVAGIFETSPAQPCYTCVRLRPKAAFPRRLAASTGSTLASSPTRCSERACIDCSWKTQKKGGTIWIEEKAWTRCNWCGRAGKAYRFDAADHQPALCGLCGRTRRLTVIWPAVLIHMAEMSVALCCIVWASWGSVQGWLVGYPDDNDWDKRKTVEVIVNVALFQMILTSVYILIWHNSGCQKSLTSISGLSYWYSMIAWLWAFAYLPSINTADPRAHQLTAFMLASGISAIVLNFIRVIMSVKGKCPF